MIQPVSYNNKPAFTGYVDKSVIKLLDKNVDKTSKHSIEYAKLFGEKVDIDLVRKALKKRSQILDNLKKFMAPLHHDTALKYNSNKFPSFFIENKKLKSKFRFIYPDSNNTGEIGYDIINVGRPKDPTSLSDILKFSDNLNKVDSKEVDRYTLKHYTNYITQKAKNISFFPEFRLKRLGKKVNKIAKEFGQSEIWQDKLLVVHREAKELERQQKIKKKEIKKIIKQNKKILKEFIINNKNSQ